MNTLSSSAHNGKPNPSTTFIYALLDPQTKQVRYIGKANNPQKRLEQHLKEDKKTYKANWIRNLLVSGQVPELCILEEVLYDQWVERERYWIAYYRENGVSLTNGTSGGEGISDPSPEERARRSNHTRYIMSDPQERARRIANLNSPDAISRRVQSRKESGYKPVVTPQYSLKLSRSVRAALENKKDVTLQKKLPHVRKHRHKSTTARETSRPLNETEREMAKSTFLAAFALRPDVGHACTVAGISRQAFYIWRNSDEVFNAKFCGLTNRQSIVEAKQEAFLQEFACNVNVTACAKKCGIKKAIIYHWIDNHEQFKVRFNAIKADWESRYD